MKYYFYEDISTIPFSSVERIRSVDNKLKIIMHSGKSTYIYTDIKAQIENYRTWLNLQLQPKTTNLEGLL